MLRVFTSSGNLPQTLVVDGSDPSLPADTVWIDLIDPSRDEELFVERVTGIEVPTAQEMAEIEHSSRLYVANGAVTMTVTLVSGIFSAEAQSNQVSFVLTPVHLITVRYGQVPVFDRFSAQLEKSPVLCASPSAALLNLMDAIVDRLADSIEHVDGELDAISKHAFRRSRGANVQRVSNLALQHLIGRIGHAQDSLSRARTSAVSLTRALGFLSYASPKKDGLNEHIKSLTRDLASLSDHATYLSGNITFLLDATLGLINVEQNVVLKIFTVVATVLMPPTLIAGIYGMNFKILPELNWHYGYAYALVFMLLSAVLPYVWFRRKGWM